MKLYLLFICIGVFVVNARAEEGATESSNEQQQSKSIGEGAEQHEMSKEERKSMRSEKHKAHKEMKKAMKEARAKHKAAVKKIHEDHKAATKMKKPEAPSVPTEEQIKKADADEDGSGDQD